jgi:L-arabinonolactonase
MQLIATLRVANVLGEGVLWHHQTGMLWWTDIQARQLLRYDWTHKTLQRYTVPERLASFGFVDDRNHAGNRLIAAFESGIALYDPDAQKIEWLARPEAHSAQVRFNDGRVDRQGRFWAGTMVEGSHAELSATLYCVDCNGHVQHRERDIRISNGLCFTVDGAGVYFADSPRRSIYLYDLQEPYGTLHHRRLFVETPPGAEPDGAIIDAEGYMWSAHWGAGQVVRYAPDGRVDRTLSIPASQPTCVAFGGPNLDLLFVTSARDGLRADALLQQPDAGAVFVYDVGIKGLPEPQYRYNPQAAFAESS